MFAVDMVAPPDDYIVNNKGVVTNIIKTDQPDRILTESGGLLPFNDKQNDPSELSSYGVGDQLVQFMGESDVESIMTKSGAGKNEGNLVSNSYSKYDFAYSTLSKDYKNKVINDKNDTRRQRGNFIESGGFYVFKGENKYNDPRKAYNIHDAGNFLWGNANKRDGHGLKKLLWGANLNEVINFRLRDSNEDQQAIIDGHKH